MKNSCLVATCDRPSSGRGWCSTHFARWRRTGDVQADVPIAVRSYAAECSAEGCLRPPSSRGLCRSHYAREMGYVDPEKPIRVNRTRNDDGSCIVPGCDRQAVNTECGLHKRRRLTTGTYDKPEPRPALITVGTRRMNAEGYILVYEPEHPCSHHTGYVLEHRKVMSDYLGRPLHAAESVHHRNGEKDDNRLPNLELWSGRHPKGSRVSDLVEFAREVLETYAEEVESGKL